MGFDEGQDVDVEQQEFFSDLLLCIALAHGWSSAKTAEAIAGDYGDYSAEFREFCAKKLESL